jgi:recombination protein RecA
MSEKIEDTLAKLDKDFGEGTVIKLSDKPQNVEAISTGSIGLDIALGIGGLPRGRIVEIYGPESSGKTTIAIHVIAEAQAKGLTCAIIDAEHAFDTDYAAALGVDIDNLYICQPESGDQGLEVADRLIESGNFGVVLIDSVAALVPKAELDGEMGESKMGLQARLMSQALRKMTGKVSTTNTLLIFINQLREKIGVMFGNPETTTGGNALKFYASVRMDVRRSITTANSVMKGEVKVGNETTAKVIKNKVAKPFKSAKFDILYGTGIDKLGELVDYAVDQKIIQKSGSWFSYQDSKIAQGRDTCKQFLWDNPEVAAEIKQLTITALINQK